MAATTPTITKPSQNCTEMVQQLRQTYNSGKTKSYAFRKQQLEAFQRFYSENIDAIAAVLKQDLGKSRQEAIITEVDYNMNDLSNTLMNLKDWMSPDRPPKALANILDAMYVYSEPYGVVLVMGSWNYPIQLTLFPVAGAIAAGNCVIIKPSDVSSATCKFIAETIPKYLDSRCCQVYTGGVPETTALLKERFDYIFFTGSTSVGRIVNMAAAQHLTPVTLELGGKSPCYLDQSADITVATTRILWGKFLNVGQTCIAPDYLLCTKATQKKFIETARKIIQQFYGENPKSSPDYGRIINAQHFQRLVTLLRTSNKSNNVAIGGEIDADQRYIAPTILADVQSGDAIMQEEIFGPILPIITIDNAYEAITFINAGEKPLVLYIFSDDHKQVDLLRQNTATGGICVNDTIMHLATDMPFGGVGASGMGFYHGRHTFDTFSHKRSCLYKSLGTIGESLAASRYPPYSSRKTTLLMFLLKKRAGFLPLKGFSYLAMFGLGLITATVLKSALLNVNNPNGGGKVPLFQ